MSKKHKAAVEVIKYLHTADAELRKAMITAADAGMRLVTQNIRESEWYLDEAIAHSERHLKKNSGKKLTNSRKRGKVSA